jgi:hypothetical protein
MPSHSIGIGRASRADQLFVRSCSRPDSRCGPQATVTAAIPVTATLIETTAG